MSTHYRQHGKGSRGGIISNIILIVAVLLVLLYYGFDLREGADRFIAWLQKALTFIINVI